MVLTSMSGFNSWDLDATSASVSTVLSDDEVVYMESIPGFSFVKGQVLQTFTHIIRFGSGTSCLLKLCKEVYTGVGYRQMQNDKK